MAIWTLGESKESERVRRDRNTTPMLILSHVTCLEAIQIKI